MSTTKLPASADLELLRRFENGMTMGALAKLYGVHHTLVSRRIARARALSTPERVERILVPPVTPKEAPPTRITKQGWGDLYLSEKTGVWMRTASVGVDRPASRRDFLNREAEPPTSFSAEYGFGQPGYDRPPVGHQEPTTRVRIPPGHPLNRGTVEHVASVENGPPLEAALRDGAILV